LGGCDRIGTAVSKAGAPCSTSSLTAGDNYQRAFLKSDISLTLRGPDDRWEIAAIGKNITDKLTASTCSPSNFRNGNVVPQITGGPARGISGFSEEGCFVERGRSVWLRLTVKPFN
jgi:hypothetical protein